MVNAVAGLRDRAHIVVAEVAASKAEDRKVNTLISLALNKALELLKDAGCYLLGALVYAISVDVFTSPNNIVPGGITGISTVLPLDSSPALQPENKLMTQNTAKSSEMIRFVILFLPCL